MTTEAPDRLLDRVRKLLAKAEAEGVTAEEAQALTAKAAELMAKYGIDRALLAAARPETDTAGQPDRRDLQPVGQGAGAPAVRPRRRAALPVHPAAGPGRPARAHVRLCLGHRADRRAVHLGADPDVARAGATRRSRPGRTVRAPGAAAGCSATPPPSRPR